MRCITAKLKGSTINHLLFKSPPPTNEEIKGVTRSSQAWGHRAGSPLLLRSWQQRGLRHVTRLREPRRHLLRVGQIQGNPVICRDDGSELSVLSVGREGAGTREGDPGEAQD